MDFVINRAFYQNFEAVQQFTLFWVNLKCGQQALNLFVKRIIYQ